MDLQEKVVETVVDETEANLEVEAAPDEVITDEKLKNYKLIVTEDGVFRGLDTSEFNNWFKTKREGYMIAPDLYRCYEDNKPDYCSGHAPKSGWAYAYDVKLGPNILRGGTQYKECPGGGHGCWYVEKYVDGKLTMIRNNKNVPLQEKIADDLWTNQWNMDDPYIKDGVKAEYKIVESEDGQRLDLYKITKQKGQFIDVKMTPLNSSTGMYLTYLLLLLRLNGEEKPKLIQLDIKKIRQPYEGRPT